MPKKWVHVTSVEVQTTPEDWEEMAVNLHVSGTPETRDYFCTGYGNWLPGDPAEIELLRVEMCVKGKWRKAIPADPYAGGHYDQAVLDAVEAWWDEHADSCWESLDEAGDEADYRRDAQQDRQMEARA
jgi:hypothetical protein